MWGVAYSSLVPKLFKTIYIYEDKLQETALGTASLLRLIWFLGY